MDMQNFYDVCYKYVQNIRSNADKENIAVVVHVTLREKDDTAGKHMRTIFSTNSHSGMLDEIVHHKRGEHFSKPYGDTSV